MSQNQIEHTITLRTGFTDDKGITHKALTFGHRLTGRDLAQADRAMEGSTSGVRRECALYRQSLTKFGELPEKEWLHGLLSLNSIDRAVVTAGFNVFHALSAEGREPKTISSEALRLGWPFKKKEQSFDTVTFGHLLTGYDEVEADSLAGAEKTFFLTARMISRLSSSEGDHALEGPFDNTLFRDLDFTDILRLYEASDEWEAEQTMLALQPPRADGAEAGEATTDEAATQSDEDLEPAEAIN